MFPRSFLKEFCANTFQIMVFVVPFHLAALAVFATYKSEPLDEKLSGTNAQVRIWSNTDNSYFYEILTLRQYASLLFGYLCSVGIIYVFVYLFLSSMDLPMALRNEKQLLHTLSTVVCVFFVSHYITLTLYAITFLFDKVNKIQSK